MHDQAMRDQAMCNEAMCNKAMCERCATRLYKGGEGNKGGFASAILIRTLRIASTLDEYRML